MILVDTSVWIAYFNGEASRQTDMLDSLIGQEPLATGDLIITEVLRGFWLENDYETVKRLLKSLTIFDLAGEEIAIKSADNCYLLRREGIDVRKPLNAIIATFCIENDLPLLFSDKDFEPFTAHLNLRAVV